MMRLLDRYIRHTLIFFTVLVFTAFVGVVFFIDLVKESGVIGQGQYDLWHAFVYVASQLPVNCYDFFPVIALLGALMGLGHLAGHHAFIVMQTAGVSLNRLLFSVMKAALCLILVTTLIGEGLGAYVSSSGAEYKLMALSGSQATPMATMGHQGVWIRYEQGGAPHFLHIGHMVNPTHLQQVTTYAFDSRKDPSLQSVSYAEKARIEKGQWIRFDVQQSDISTDHISRRSWHRKVEPLGFDARLLISAGTTPAQYTLGGLYSYIQAHAALKTVPPDLRWYDFIFWKRVFQPLLTLLVILLAVPCMIGSLRSVPMGFRLLVGLVLGLALHLMGALLGSLSSVGYLSPLLAAGLPASVFLFIGLWFVLCRLRC